MDYLNRAERLSYGRRTPHLLSESLGWHNRYLRSGQMQPHGEDWGHDRGRVASAYRFSFNRNRKYTFTPIGWSP